MVKYQDVEFVCSGNMDRSPLAEAIAKKYLDNIGRAHELKISSSGTLVNYFGNLSEADFIGILRSNLEKLIGERLIDERDSELITEGKGIEQIVQKLRGKGRDNRRVVVHEKGLIGYFDINRDPIQTVVRSEAELILPMDDGGYERVNGIYSQSGANPKIEVLGEIEDPFLASLETYQIIADQIEKATLEAMKKFLYIGG
jgi:protein-tyrosine-phosphatase